LSHQIGILGETFHQNLFGALKRCVDICDSFVRLNEVLCQGFRRLSGIFPEAQGERFKAGFPGDLGLGAAPGFERQIQILQACFGVGSTQGLFQFGGQFVLPADGLEDDISPLFQFPQINQPFFQGP